MLGFSCFLLVSAFAEDRCSQDEATLLQLQGLRNQVQLQGLQKQTSEAQSFEVGADFDMNGAKATPAVAGTQADMGSTWATSDGASLEVHHDVERTIEEFEDEGGHSRVAADQLAPPPIDGFAPGVAGWCRAANGEAEGVNGAVLVPARNVRHCANQCLASPTCQAFEWSAPRRNRQFPKACKLHNSPMPGPVGEVDSNPDGYAQCYNTAAAAEAAIQFFHNSVGTANVIGDFATDDDVTGARGNFLRRVDCASRVVRAHVQGGSCGDATVQFRIDDAAAEYFRSGTQGPNRCDGAQGPYVCAGWTQLTDVTVVSGEVRHLPDMLFTGHGNNRGWMLCEDRRAARGRVNVLPRKCFANSRVGFTDSETVASNRLQVSDTVSRTGWDRCNSNRLQGGETVTLECV